ncbi:MAG: SpoIIE family protein phosphatase [Bacteroidales bacterium]|nr:SpoIIE family protein phosphatase [Bacteroidales bacterium]
MLSRLHFSINNIQKKIVFYIVVITIPMFLVTLYLVQEMVSRELMRSESRQARLINMNTLKKVESFLDKTSSFTVKASYMITANPSHYNKIFPFLRQNIQQNQALFGSALALDPGGPLKKTYCKYFYHSQDSIRVKWLMPPQYDYVQKPWYAEVKNTLKPVWSEPYFDKGGGDVYMSTYSYPIFNLKKRFLGVVTADVELNTLSQKIQDLSHEKGEFIFLVSKSGFLLSHPNKNFSLRQNIFKYAEYIHSDTLKKAAIDMEQGKSGTYSIQLPDGQYTLYTMYIEQTSWSIGIFLKDSVLFKPLNQLKVYLLIIMLGDIILILIMVLIISDQLKKNVASEERIKNEFVMASRIQRQFLPKKGDVDELGFNLSGIMLPAREVGGDFYGYEVKNEKLIFYVGDVSGKGVPSSLFMMASQMLINDAIEEKCDPAYVLDKVNLKLSRISTTGMFATLIVGVLELKTGNLTFSVAGHPPFIINTQGAVYSPITFFAPPVAVFEDQRYKNETIELKKGSFILAFSDGVSEAENKQKALYGTERVARIVQNLQGLNSKGVRDKLLKDIQKYTFGQEQSDDLTLVVVNLL